MNRLKKTITRIGKLNILRFRRELRLMRRLPDHFDLFKRLQDREERALAHTNLATREIFSAMQQRDRTTVEAAIGRIQLLTEIVETVGEVETTLFPNRRAHNLVPAAPPSDSASSVYCVSSWFLSDSYRFLLAHTEGHERLHFVTGIRLGATRTLDRMVEVAIERQSAVYAAADPLAAQRVLIEMDEWGHTVHGLFHSHPGQGPAATRPSGTDLNTHERYERGGYPLVGAIFVRDGYVRFFSSNHTCSIILYGTGVHRVDDNLFKISNLSGGPTQDGQGGRGAGDRPTRALVRIQPGKSR